MNGIPPWMHKFELVTGALSVLCMLAVIMIVVLHLWLRSDCTSLGIC